MGRAVGRVGAGGERVRCDAKRGLRGLVVPLVEAEGTNGETDLRRDEPGSGARALVEAAAEPEQLDAALHLVADDDGHDQRTLGPQALGQPGQRLGGLAELDLAGRQLVERQAPALELDRERCRRRRNGAHDQLQSIGVEDAREDDICSCEACRGLHDHPQDVPEPGPARGGTTGVRERFQRPRIEPGPLAPLRLHCHPGPCSV